MACSPADLEKYNILAREEIGEIRVNLSEIVKQVREIVLTKYTELRLPPDADHILEKCLRYRKFDLEKGAEQVHLYFKFLLDSYTAHKDLYFLPSVVRDYFLDSLGFALLKYRDSKGRAVFMIDFEKLPAKVFRLDKAIACWTIVMDEVTRVSVETQRVGVVFVCNLKGYEFGHTRQWTLSRLRLLANGFRGAAPLRLKGLHVVRCPAIFAYTYAILKPLLGHKLNSRIHFHGYDLNALQKHVSPDILPESLGGTLTMEECVDSHFMRRLYSKEGYFKELFQYGYINFNTTTAE